MPVSTGFRFIDSCPFTESSLVARGGTSLGPLYKGTNLSSSQGLHPHDLLTSQDPTSKYDRVED